MIIVLEPQSKDKAVISSFNSLEEVSNALEWQDVYGKAYLIFDQNGDWFDLSPEKVSYGTVYGYSLVKVNLINNDLLIFCNELIGQEGFNNGDVIELPEQFHALFEHREALKRANESNKAVAEVEIAKSAARAFLSTISKWIDFTNWSLMVSGAIFAVVVVNLSSVIDAIGSYWLFVSLIALGISVAFGLLGKYQLMQVQSGIDTLTVIENEVFSIMNNHYENSSVVEEGGQLIGEQMNVNIDLNKALEKYQLMFPWIHRKIFTVLFSFAEMDELVGYRFHIKWMCCALPLVGLQLIGMVSFIVIIGWSVWASAQGMN